jgi:F0F1-type ATP synthase assembly protein I
MIARNDKIDEARDRFVLDRGAVESMEHELQEGKPAIFASYGLIGAILACTAVGFLADRAFSTQPWCLLIGLVAGLAIGLYGLARIIRH